MSDPGTRGSLKALAILIAVGLLFTAALVLGRGFAPENDRVDGRPTDRPGNDPGATRDALCPVLINQPDGPPRIETGLFDDLGRPVTVSCASCHANSEPRVETRSSAELEEFHVGLHVQHGEMACLTCHNVNNYNALRLADGSELAYENVRTLCAQCHSPQHRDYLNGAHGGMNGYWDRTRGPQHRKNCIDCHDPHAPAFPHMMPTFKPHDRFLAPSHDH